MLSINRVDSAQIARAALIRASMRKLSGSTLERIVPL